MTKFSVGEYVYKQTGYSFRGVVDAVFKTQEGNIRYVVEAISNDGTFDGMLHIFNENQLASCGLRRKKNEAHD